MSPHVHAGTLTAIEWAKDLEEEADPDAPAFKRDTTQVYFVSSRDGVSVDLSWVYAHRPMLPKDGLRQSDWGSGFLLPAAQILTDDATHKVYFEARRTRHEHRFDRPGVIGVAAWQRDRIVGLRCARQGQEWRRHLPLNATSRAAAYHGIRTRANSCELRTRLFTLAGQTLLVDAHIPPGGSRRHESSALRVEVIGRYGGRVVASSALLRTIDSDRAVVEWLSGASDAQGAPITTRSLASLVSAGSVVSLRFTLFGDARLYAFQFSEGDPSPPVSASAAGTISALLHSSASGPRSAPSSQHAPGTPGGADNRAAAAAAEVAAARAAPGSDAEKLLVGSAFVRAAGLTWASGYPGDTRLVDGSLSRDDTDPNRAVAAGMPYMIVPVNTITGADAPRYFSIFDDPLPAAAAAATAAAAGRAATPWCDEPARTVWPAHVCGRLLLLARVGRRQTTGRNLHGFASHILSLQEGQLQHERNLTWLSGTLHLWPSAVVPARPDSNDVGHNLGAVVAPAPLAPRPGASAPPSTEAAGGGAVLYAIGGQHTQLPNGRGSDGVYLLHARTLSEILTGAWFPPSQQGLLPGNASATSPSPSMPPPSSLSSSSSSSSLPLLPHTRHKLFDGHHPGCVERRGGSGTPCEYDGKLSVAFHPGHRRFLLYSRANLKAEGGRFVQVAVSLGSGAPPAQFSPFALITSAFIAAPATSALSPFNLIMCYAHGSD